jgi:NADPH oxidase
MLAFYTHATGCFVRDDAHPHSPFEGKEFWQHCIGYQAWRFTLVAGGLYLAERLWREVRSSKDTEITKVVRHPFSKFRV